MRYRVLSNLRAIGLHLFAILLAVALFIVLVPMGWGPLLGHWLTAPPTPLTTAQSDVIAVLGGDTQIRAADALTLLKPILKTNPNVQLLITGDVPEQKIPDWRFAELAQQDAIAQGVPAQSITLLTSATTAEDGLQIADYISRARLHRLTIITDWWHSRRALCVIQQTTGPYNVQVNVSNTPLSYGPDDWWQSADGRSAVLLEFTKNVYYAVHYDVPIWDCLPTDFNIGGFLATMLGAGLLSLLIAWRLRASQAYLLNVSDSLPRQPKPRHGGTGLILATLILFGFSYLTGTDLPVRVGVVYLILGAILALVTWLAERRSIPGISWQIALLILAVILTVVVGPISLLAVPKAGIAVIGLVAGGLLTIVWIMGLTATFTSLKQAEGLVGTQTFFAGAAWTLLLLTQGQLTLGLLAGLLSAASVGLLVLNAPPARILIGKPGSAFAGFTLASLPMLGFHQTQDARWFGVGVLFVAPFLYEVGLNLIGRGLRRVSPHPLYQWLLDLGQPALIVPTLYGLLAIVSDFCGFVYYAGTPILGLFSLALIVATLIAFTALIALLIAAHQRFRATLIAPV